MVFAVALKLRLNKWLQTIMVEAKRQGPWQATTAFSVWAATQQRAALYVTRTT